MMTATRTFTRPATTIAWHTEPSVGIYDDAFRTYFTNTYVTTGKCTYQNFAEDPSGLNLAYVSHWTSLADYEEYKSDPFFDSYKNKRDEYFLNNNITYSDSLETV